MNESELKARLAEAEALFGRYRWDEAIATFEVILTARPEHAAAAQGLADALEQKKTDEELAETVRRARESLAGHLFSDALAALNRAQTRGAMRHILKYHGEIDGLRSKAQEGRELQRMADQTLERAEGLAGQRKFDVALAALDGGLQELSARGWESLAGKLRAARDRLWAERDVDERVRFAQAAFERQDYQTATELAEVLHRQLPKRDDVARLHERARAAWTRIQERLKSVQEQLAEERLDDAVALLARLRDEYPENPDWQALWLKAHLDHARNLLAAGRRAVAHHQFAAAAESFAAAVVTFDNALSIFDSHATANLERTEAEALHAVALFAVQAELDSAAGRWEASRRAWEMARVRLREAAQVRQRDYGELEAVVDTMLAEVQSIVTDLEQARHLLADGRRALEEHDAGRAREAFRGALDRAGKSADELSDEALAGLREAEHVQREATRLVAQAEHVTGDADRLALLRSAYDRWMTAPGLAEKLATVLLAGARGAFAAGDEEQAVTLCDQIRGLPGAPAAQQAEAASLAAGIRGRRKVQAALAEATRLLAELERAPAPSAAGYEQVIELLSGAAAYLAQAPELAATLNDLLERARDHRARLAAVEPLLGHADAYAEAGNWPAAARELDGVIERLGDMASRDLIRRAEALRVRAAAVEAGLARAGAALAEAEAAYAVAGDGNPTRVLWPQLQAALARAQAELSEAPAHPLPPAWEELQARITDLAERSALLRQVAERIHAGSAVDGLPLLQAIPADPVLVAVRAALRRASTGVAHERAAACLAAAEAHLAAGEVPAAQASMAEAASYSTAAPELSRAVRWLETRLSLVSRAQALTAESRRHLTEERPDEARRACRLALELLVAAEGNLPGDAREALNALLMLEEELWEEAARAEAEALYRALLAADDSPLLKVCLPAPLRLWWRLTCRAADLAYIEAQLALERDFAAYLRAQRVVISYPTDGYVRELYTHARQQMSEHVAAALGRRLERATRLRGEGAYAAALAELDRIETELQAPLDAVSADIDHHPVLGPLFGAAADLRMEVIGLNSLAQRLTPLLEQAREAGLAGQYHEAQLALSRAELLDPNHRAAALWTEFAALGNALRTLAQAETRATLTTTLTETDARLDLGPTEHELREIIVRLAAAGLSVQALDAAEDERLRTQLAAVKARAASGWARLEKRSQVLPPAPPVVTLPPPSAAVQPQAPERHSIIGSLEPDDTHSPRPGLQGAEYLAARRPDAAPPLAGNAESAPVWPQSRAASMTDRHNGASLAPEPTPIPRNSKQAPALVQEPEEPILPPAPFDYEDWGSNLTPLAPDDDAAA